MASSAVPNDDLANATRLEVGLGVGATAQESVAGATAQSGEDVTLDNGRSTSGTVWYSFVMPRPRFETVNTADITTAGSDYKTTIQVFRLVNPALPLSFENLLEVASNDDAGTAKTSTLTFSGTGDTRYFVQIGAADGTPSAPRNLIVSITPFACYMTGTRIATPQGPTAVEDLAAGDLIVTASGDHRTVRWVGYRTIDCSGPSGSEHHPIRIRAGAFAPGRPERDLYVSANHAMFLDGALIPAQYLVNGTSIVRIPVPAITYWHVELDSHDLLIAEGVASETYKDTGNRAGFENATEALPFSKPTVLCAPIMFNGPRVDAVRTRIAARSAAVTDPDHGDCTLLRLTGAPGMHPRSLQVRIALVA